MKHIFTSLLLLVALLLPTTAFADYEQVEIDGIYYNIYGNEASVTYPIHGYYSGNVNIPETVTWNDTVYPVTGIGMFAFANCSCTSVTIPEFIKHIDWKAYALSSIKTVYFNAIDCSVSFWAEGDASPFEESSIETIIFGNRVKSIPAGLAINITTLSNVFIPSSVKSIGIPSSWLIWPEEYEPSVFSGCTGLQNVYSYIIKPMETSMNWNIFYLISNNYEGRTLHVPYGTSSAYQADNRWCQYFESIVEMEPGETNFCSMPDTIVMHGEQITIPIRLDNNLDILAFQTDIFLPEGFSLATNQAMEPVVTPSGRLTSDHVMMTQNVSNGAVRVMCYTPNALPIEGNEGDLFYITVQVPDDAAGDYTIYLRNTRLTTTDYTELRAPEAGAVLTVKTYIPGDVNDSRSVNVADIVTTAMYIMEMEPSPFIFDAADMNGDGEVTVTDVMLIARMILYPETMNAPRHAPAIGANDDRMSGEVFTTGEIRTVSILLDNETDYSAFQLDLTLPHGLTASNFQLTDRAGNHALDVNTLASGKTRVLCYTPAIEAISGNEGAVLTFDVTASSPVDGDITVDGIELVTIACQMVRLDAFTIVVNGATAVNEVTTGKTIARVDYYNVAGQRLAQPESGVTLVITTYTDGTRTTTKLIQ